MTFVEKVSVSKNDLNHHMLKIHSDLFKGVLSLEGNTVRIPEDVDFEVKVKYTDEGANGAVTIKIGWEKTMEESTEDQA